MLVTSAFDTDNVQLYDYCHRNDLLRNPEISTIFELEIPAKRTVGEKPLAVADSESEPLPHAGRAEAMHMNMHIRSQNPKEPRIQISRTLKHAKMSPLTQNDSDDKKRKRIEAKYEDAIEGATSDTDDYDTSSSNDSSSKEGAAKLSRRRRNTSKAHSRKSDSESDEGTWLDTASDSDDRSS